MENNIVFSLPSNLISSLVLCEQINIFRQVDGKKELRHDNLLSVIRDEFEEEISLLKIKETPYIHPQNKQTYYMYELTHSQAKQVLVRESKTVRKAVIAYIEKLEKSLPNFNNPAEAARAWALEYEAKQLAEKQATLYKGMLDIHTEIENKQKQLRNLQQEAVQIGYKFEDPKANTVISNLIEDRLQAWKDASGMTLADFKADIANWFKYTGKEPYSMQAINKQLREVCPAYKFIPKRVGEKILKVVVFK